MAIAKTIGAINVDLTARTRGFDKGVDKSRKGVKLLTTAVGQLGAALAATFGARTLYVSLRRFGNEMSNLAKTSRALGTTVEDLQNLRRAAEDLGGMDIRQFDTALQRMVRRTGTADPLGTLRQIADEIASMRSDGEQLAVAFKFFDSEGARGMVNVLKGGSAALDEMLQKSRELGEVISTEQAEAIEELDQRFSDLLLKFERWAKRQVVETLAPGANPRVAMQQLRERVNQAEVDNMRRRATARFAALEPRNLQTMAGRGQDLQTVRMLQGILPGLDTVQRSLASVGRFLTADRRVMAAPGGPLGPMQLPIRGGVGAFGEPPTSIAQMMRDKFAAQSNARGMLAFAKTGSAAAFRQQADIRRNQEQIQLDKKRNDILQEIQTAMDEGLPVVVGMNL